VLIQDLSQDQGYRQKHGSLGKREEERNHQHVVSVAEIAEIKLPCTAVT
jgi:hypothetical protein